MRAVVVADVVATGLTWIAGFLCLWDTRKGGVKVIGFSYSLGSHHPAPLIEAQKQPNAQDGLKPDAA